MDKLIINGGKKLTGKVSISGSKNSALPILFATLLTDEEVILYNVAELADINTAVKIIEYLGKKVVRDDHKVVVTTRGFPPKTEGYIVAPYDLIRTMRASFLVSGALLAKNRKVKVALPGGCAIGVRPVDIHISAFEHFGCKHFLEEGYVVFHREKLYPAKVKLKYPSVGATENVILISSLIDGEVVIENAAREPEIVDLVEFVKKLGVEISGEGTSKISIRGVRKIKNKKVEHTIIPDRIETGTYIIATLATRGEVEIENVIWQHNRSLIRKLINGGAQIIPQKNCLYVKYKKELKPSDVVTGPYPSFPTDLQAQYMSLMCITKGRCVVRETVFENRFIHVAELQRMGADLQIEDSRCYVNGVEKLIGCPVMVSDLRAGAALVIAGLVAEGRTEINRVYHLDRGYEKLEYKLSKLGADIKRVK